MSSGSSIWQAPGFSVVASLQALRTISGMLSGFTTMWAHLVIGRNMPTTSIAWWLSLCRRLLSAWPVSARTGARSMFASATPVTRLAAPGPRVPRQTPTSPVRRPTASAMKAAPCSCLQSTNSIGESSREIMKSAFSSPGTPKMRLTPSAWRHSTNRSDALRPAMYASWDAPPLEAIIAGCALMPPDRPAEGGDGEGRRHETIFAGPLHPDRPRRPAGLCPASSPSRARTSRRRGRQQIGAAPPCPCARPSPQAPPPRRGAGLRLGARGLCGRGTSRPLLPRRSVLPPRRFDLGGEHSDRSRLGADPLQEAPQGSREARQGQAARLETPASREAPALISRGRVGRAGSSLRRSAAGPCP